MPELDDLPKSRDWIYRTIRDEGPLTRLKIEEKTGYTDRTVRAALSDLQERDIVEREDALSYPFKHRYSVV